MILLNLNLAPIFLMAQLGFENCDPILQLLLNWSEVIITILIAASSSSSSQSSFITSSSSPALCSWSAPPGWSFSSFPPPLLFSTGPPDKWKWQLKIKKLFPPEICHEINIQWWGILHHIFRWTAKPLIRNIMVHYFLIKTSACSLATSLSRPCSVSTWFEMLTVNIWLADIIRKSQLPEHVHQHIWPQQPHNELSSRQVVRHIGCAVRRFHSYVIYQEGHPCKS